MAKRKSKQSILSVEGELTIYRVGELQASLFPALVRAEELTLDLSGVAELDTAGIQLLMMLKREAKKLNKRMVFSNHSNAVITVFEALNLSSQFGDPVFLSATL